MNKRQRIAAVVVTYNRKVLLQECLLALLKQTHKPDAIYVVDNASTDGTERLFESWQFSDSIIQYSRLAENLGGAGGFAYGIEIARANGYDWVWVMDDDAEPLPDALSALAAEIESSKDTQVSALAALVLNADGSPQTLQRGFFDYIKAKQTQISLFQADSAHPFDIDYAGFVGVLINGQAIDRMGLPHKEFFIWFDDVEYCLRLKKFGQIVLVPNAKILHKDQGGTASGVHLPIQSFWKMYYGLRNRSVIAHTYCGKGHVFFAWLYFKAVVKSLMSRDHVFIRLKMVLKSYSDFLLGVSGKRVDPKDYLSSLK